MFHYFIELTYVTGIKNTFTASDVRMYSTHWEFTEYYSGGQKSIAEDEIQVIAQIKITPRWVKTGESTNEESAT